MSKRMRPRNCFSRKLRKLMEGKDLNYVEVAAAVDVWPQRIFDWCEGVIPDDENITTLLKLGEYFNIDLMELLDIKSLTPVDDCLISEQDLKIYHVFKTTVREMCRKYVLPKEDSNPNQTRMDLTSNQNAGELKPVDVDYPTSNGVETKINETAA